MYQADFICTYNLMETPEDQEMLFQIQLLQAFDLQEWDDAKVHTILEELYTIIIKDKSLQVILEKISKVEALQPIIEMTPHKTKREKDLILFSLLFQYEYFDLFHNCILDFTHKGEIKEQTMQKLITTF
jgi:hypothetical protein